MTHTTFIQGGVKVLKRERMGFLSRLLSLILDLFPP